jgi:hypothetical protein
MNKKVVVGFIVVFVLMEVVSFVVNYLLLGSTYESLNHLWRPDMESKMWIFHVLMIIGAFFFTFIFSKGYEGKGIAEGVRYGLYIGIWMSIGKAYGTYAMIDIPYSLALQWFLYGTVEHIIYGIALALVFGGSSKEQPAAT